MRRAWAIMLLGVVLTACGATAAPTVNTDATQATIRAEVIATITAEATPPTETPRPTATSSPTSTPPPTVTRTPEPTATSTARPSSTPTATAAPSNTLPSVPTDTPLPPTDTPVSVPADTATPAAVAAATEAPTLEPTATEEPAPQSQVHALGEAVQVGTWEIAAREVHWEKALYFYDDSIVAMGKYLIVIFDARNLSPGTDYVGRTLLTGIFDVAGGHEKTFFDREPMELTANAYAEWQFGGKSDVYSDVAPGATAGIAVVFDMPEGLTSAEFDVGFPNDVTSIQSWDLGNVQGIPAYKPQQ